MTELTLHVEQTANLDPPDRAAVDFVCGAARPGEDIGTLFRFLPPDGRHIMGYLGETLVSHAVVTTRWLQLEGLQPEGLQPEGLPLLKTAYIDAVSTIPSEQGKGYGSTVMSHLTTVIPDYEIGALQTERVSFYKRVGWELWLGSLAGREDDGTLIPTPSMLPDQIMIHRLRKTPPLDLTMGLSIECGNGRVW